MSGYDEKLKEAVSQIRGQQDRILEDFCKAYLASMSLSHPRDIAWIIKHLQLNTQKTDDNDVFGFKYWFSLREDEK